MSKRSIVSTIVVIILLAAPVYMQAQSVRGTILGNVTDASGGVVPNAQMTITNEGTSLSRSAVTTVAGQFRVPQLVSGVYTVTAEAPGFEQTVVRGVIVSVASETRVDVKLSVAGTSQAVTVTEEALAVNTTTAAVAELMSEELISQIPLNARDIQQVAGIQPGVQFDYNNNWGNQIVISGSRPQQNRYLQEGIDTTWTSKTAPVSAAGIVLGIEAVKEFQVLTSNYSAQYGERPGGTLNAIFKSGVNTLHGSAFEYYRNAVFDAASIFDENRTPPDFSRNQFGASFGGPIQKDKHFFFFNYEGYRHTLGQTQILTVPDENARNGILPSGPVAGFVPGGFIQGAINLMVPTCTGPPRGDGTCDSANVSSQKVSENYYVGKLDFTLSANNSLAASYNFDASLSNSPQKNPNFELTQKVRKQILTLRDTHTFSPNLLNTISAGLNRTFFLWDLNAAIPIPDTINGGNPFSLPGGGLISPTGLPVLPVINVTGIDNIASFSSGTTVTPRWVGYTAGTFADDMDYLNGKHAVKFGVQYKKWDDNIYNSASRYQGTVFFSSLANLLAGNARAFNQIVPGTSDVGRGWRQWLLGLYVEDTYRMLSNFTITAGLRWEYVPGPSEMYGRISNLEDPESSATPTVGTYFHSSKKLFDPRLGINWDPFGDGKTSVRAGFGIFHDQLTAYYIFISGGHNLPFSRYLNLRSSPATTPLPSWPTPSITDLQNSPSGSSAFAGTMPFYPKTPTKTSYNMEIQRKLPWDLAFSVGYVGSTSVHLGRSEIFTTLYPIVQQPGSTTGCSVTELAGGMCGCPTESTSACLFWPGTTGANPKPTICSNSITTNCSSLVNPAWSSVAGTVFDANAFYNSLEVRLQRNVSTGLNWRFGYTHSSCITDSSGETPGSALNAATVPAYARLPGSNRARCSFTGSDVANFTISYEVPKMTFTSGLARALVNNWQISSLTAISSGYPLNVIAGVGSSRQDPAAGAGGDRPNLAPGCTVENAVNPGSTNYIKGECLVLQTPGYMGYLAANAFTGPSFWSTDASLKRNFPFGRERMSLQVQVDMFNVFNRTNLGTTSNSIAAFSTSGPNKSFGKIRTIVGTPRQLQFGARFSF